MGGVDAAGPSDRDVCGDVSISAAGVGGVQATKRTTPVISDNNSVPVFILFFLNNLVTKRSLINL